MKRFAITSSILVLLLAQVVCCDPGGGGYVTPEDNNGGGGDSTANSIGIITRVLNSVWAGPSGSLSPVNDPPPNLYNDYSVKLAGGGKALLEFHSNITFTLYNDTETGGIYGEVDPSVPNYLRMKLIRGGLQGQVAKAGSTAEIEVAYGTTIRVVGTTFYVVYDEATRYTSIGNYDGELYFYPNGGGEVFLPSQTQVDVAPDGALYYYDLPNDPGLFDELSTETASPVDGLGRLRAHFDQPPPGGEKPISTVVRTLVKAEGDSFIPDLAESWEVNEAGDVITFHLRPGILLPGGEPFTTTDVRDRLEKDFSYARDGLVSFELADDLTILFYLYDVDYYTVMEELAAFEFEVQAGSPLN